MTVFEKIIKKELPSIVVYEDEKFLAFEDIRPLAPVHIVIIPKIESKTAPNINVCELEMLPDLFKIINALAREKGIDTTGYRIVTNCGEHAGQTVEHLHFHLLGGAKLGKPC